MNDPKNSPSDKRRKIKEQAMQVLRETRAKIDPVLLALMKDKISATGLAGAPKVAPQAPEKKGVFAAELVDAMTKKIEPKVPEAKTSANAAAQSYKSTAAPAAVKTDPSKPEMVPVDRQKIAAIVMEYMRLREEKKPGH